MAECEPEIGVQQIIIVCRCSGYKPRIREYRHSSLYSVVTFRKEWRALNFAQVTYGHYTREFIWNPNSKTLEPDRPQNDRPVSGVFAQKYSSAAFVQLRFHFRKEYIRRVLKMWLAWSLGNPEPGNPAPDGLDNFGTI